MSKNITMSTDAITIAEAVKELDQAIARLMRSDRDPEIMRRAAERMDQMREDLRKRIGTVDIAVDLIRDAREP